MQAYEGLRPYYGDLHNHCDISYGHGSLDAAFQNAREQLDFCSVTGHALWPDMPEADGTIDYIVDFHREGFARLRRRWAEVQRTTAAYHDPGDFVTFLSFEIHSSADGDYTVLYRDFEGEILEVDGLAGLRRAVGELRVAGVDVMAFPHHIGYRRRQRGINWATFDEALSPVVEIVSMHGCSAADEVPRPFLHVMGPSDHQSTMWYGLNQGHLFGVLGSTDHHSAFPGSYGHGRTGVWARAKTRRAIWDALRARRTVALTGDRMAVAFAINGEPMGARLPPAERREVAFHVVGGAAIDYVDIVKNGELLRRVSRPDVAHEPPGDLLRTKLALEVGWGERGVPVDWEVALGISDGRILAVEPRFRGPEVVAPTEVAPDTPEDLHVSHWEPDGPRGIRFHTTTFGNPNTRTPAMQGICLDVEMPVGGRVVAEINGRAVEIPLVCLLEGARAGRLGKIASGAYRFHRAPLRWEFDWRGEFEDVGRGQDVYALRVRQLNDQWAWSSPIAVGR
jgi:hypothetical protein